jgi:5-methylcytosine-specific restriction endonuclease McrA
MTKQPVGGSHLSDHELLEEVKAAALCERQATARLIALLIQIDIRRLYLGEGCSSLFTYCTQVLHLSEHAAYGRIEAARAGARLPFVLELLEDGAVTLTTVTLLAPHLTLANHREVLNEARDKSKRDVERIVARLRPEPPVASVVRRLPSTRAHQPSINQPERDERSEPALVPAPAPPCPPVVAPLAPERYRVQFTVSRETHDKLRRAQDLLRHSIPNGDPAEIFDRALTVLIGEVERTRLAATSRPRASRPATPGLRHIPAAVKREVWKRDGGQCAFVGTQGRCTERGFLEFHHVVPYAVGGPGVASNIELRCRAHNMYEAEERFGPFVREARGPAYTVATRSGPGRAPRSPVRGAGSSGTRLLCGIGAPPPSPPQVHGRDSFPLRRRQRARTQLRRIRVGRYRMSTSRPIITCSPRRDASESLRSA